MNVELPDGSVLEDVPDGTPKWQILGKLQLAKHPAVPEMMKQMASEETLNSMGGMEKFNAGTGLAFQNIGRAAKQMVGMDTDYGENKTMDRALTSTGAGAAGNVAGNIAAFAPLSVIPGANTVAGAGALGAIMGAFQPTDKTSSRIENMGVGGTLGAGLQAVAQYPAQTWEAVKAPFKAVRAAIEPLYEGGREKVISRVINSATNGNGPAVQARMSRAQELVPGSAPTAAEVGESGGLAALQRTAAATNPEAYATRATQQNEARVKELLDLAGTQGQRGSVAANRDAVASQLYKRARDQGLDQGMSAALKPQMKNLMERMPSGVMERARELARLNGEVMGKDGSVNGLHWMKQAVDDMLSGGASSGIGKQTERALVQYKQDLLSVIDELSPAYANARTTFQTMSKPLNQMDIAQRIADKSMNPLTGQLKPEMYARALSDDTAAAATGFNKATLENTLEPSQMARLNAIKQDLARSVMARDLGRGPGSDTVQKMSMGNIAQQAGLPMSVTKMPGVGRFGNWIYDSADERMRQMLADSLLDPKKTSQVMALTQNNRPLAPPPKAVTDKAALLARALALPAGATVNNQ